MGLDSNGTRFLLYGRSRGVDFSRTAMIGRQGLHLSPADLRDNLAQFRSPVDDSTLAALFEQQGGYAEGLFELLGARQVESFDFSPYERATHLHDMNLPIPAEFKNRYTLVLDSGSLEHVFNFPTAIRNCMEMIEPGGHFIGITPANNFFGHGFYQFSAETFFRIFSKENGFEMVSANLYESTGDCWYSVPDPQQIKRRVTLRNYRETYLAVLSRKVESRPIFAVTPQQSDYVAIWDRGSKLPAQQKSSRGILPTLADLIQKCVPSSVKQSLKRRALSTLGIHRVEDFPEFFRPINSKAAPPRE